MTLKQKYEARNMWFLRYMNTAQIARYLELPEHVVYNDRSWQTLGEIRR